MDIIDVMFGWFVDIFSWIIDKLIKLCTWVIKVVFLGIIALFKSIFSKKEPTPKADNTPEVNQN